jgi:hypothetical protein
MISFKAYGYTINQNMIIFIRVQFAHSKILGLIHLSQMFIFLKFNLITSYSLDSLRILTKLKSCSAQTRTGIGHLRKLPGVENSRLSCIEGEDSGVGNQ